MIKARANIKILLEGNRISVRERSGRDSLRVAFAGGIVAQLTSVSFYFAHLEDALSRAQFTLMGGYDVGENDALGLFENHLQQVRLDHAKVIIIGNGGSCSIASHFMTDLIKRVRIPAQTTSDTSLFTCLANDYGFARAYEEFIEVNCSSLDLLIALSSSGASPNILAAVEAAKSRGTKVITLCGFSPDCALRHKGDLNVYFPSTHYGMVELSSAVYLHYVVDKLVGDMP